MPTATLTFTLPDDSWGHRCAVHAEEMAAGLGEIREILRAYRKHGTRSLKAAEAVLDDIGDTVTHALVWEEA